MLANIRRDGIESVAKVSADSQRIKVCTPVPVDGSSGTCGVLDEAILRVGSSFSLFSGCVLAFNVFSVHICAAFVLNKARCIRWSFSNSEKSGRSLEILTL